MRRFLVLIASGPSRPVTTRAAKLRVLSRVLPRHLGFAMPGPLSDRLSNAEWLDCVVSAGTWVGQRFVPLANRFFDGIHIVTRPSLLVGAVEAGVGRTSTPGFPCRSAGRNTLLLFHGLVGVAREIMFVVLTRRWPCPFGRS